MNLYKCFFSIIVICINNYEWLFDNIFTYQYRLSCSPWLASPCRLFNSFREIIQLLICISKFYVQFITNSFNSFSDRIMKCISDILTNDKYYFIKSGLYCIMNGIIHNDLPIWAYRFQLLNSAAKTRTHSCSHDD